ncbi:hypothetical protein G1H11_09350 [Phytoactinopolyspora alkaliphila]|uniref:LppM domain-containing protein n=1 Tax=Phytoactinopolyspora alkaliphila TaxID=1783498 RepID=A0A6N9YKY9_9ACTN|nr:hypothetical protein [Phytoactinopolyspora alkaliphila]NED95518.1 hypothetical protein [Phytoactinopolyspora alkaliphila]
MKMDMNLELNTDDTIDGSVVMAFSKDFMDMAGMMGEDADMDEMFEGFMDFDPEGEDVPDYASVEPYDDGEFVGQQINFDGAPLEDFSEGTDMSGLSIVREGDQFVVEGDMDMSDASTGEMEDIPPGMLENMDFDLRVAITFPGEVLEHNGSLDGTTVTWEPEIGAQNDMFARAMDSGGAGGGMPVWLWIVIGVVIVAGLAALLFLMSRNKGESAPVMSEGGAVPPPAAPGAPVPPPAPAQPDTDPAGPEAAPAAPGEPVPDDGKPADAALDPPNTESRVDVPDPAAPEGPDAPGEPR